MNFVYEITLSIEKIGLKIALYIGSGYVLCKRLFSLFGAFAVKVRDWCMGSFRGLFGRVERITAPS